MSMISWRLLIHLPDRPLLPVVHNMQAQLPVDNTALLDPAAEHIEWQKTGTIAIRDEDTSADTARMSLKLHLHQTAQYAINFAQRQKSDHQQMSNRHFWCVCSLRNASAHSQRQSIKCLRSRMTPQGSTSQQLSLLTMATSRHSSQTHRQNTSATSPRQSTNVAHIWMMSPQSCAGPHRHVVEGPSSFLMTLTSAIRQLSSSNHIIFSCLTSSLQELQHQHQQQRWILMRTDIRWYHWAHRNFNPPWPSKTPRTSTSTSAKTKVTKHETSTSHQHHPAQQAGVILCHPTAVENQHQHTFVVHLTAFLAHQRGIFLPPQQQHIMAASWPQHHCWDASAQLSHHHSSEGWGTSFLSWKGVWDTHLRNIFWAFTSTKTSLTRLGLKIEKGAAQKTLHITITHPADDQIIIIIIIIIMSCHCVMKRIRTSKRGRHNHDSHHMRKLNVVQTRSWHHEGDNHLHQWQCQRCDILWKTSQNGRKSLVFSKLWGPSRSSSIFTFSESLEPLEHGPFSKDRPNGPGAMELPAKHQSW